MNSIISFFLYIRVPLLEETKFLKIEEKGGRWASTWRLPYMIAGSDWGCLLSGGWAAAFLGADRMSDVPSDLGQ